MTGLCGDQCCCQTEDGWPDESMLLPVNVAMACVAAVYIPFTPPPPLPLCLQARRFDRHARAKCPKPAPFIPKKPNWHGWPR